MDYPALRSWPMEDEVLGFLTDQASYSARTRSGRHLRILRARNFQPEVRDEENFATFLWLETTEGYFLMRQHLVGHRPLAWFLLRRVVPVQQEPCFFHDFHEHLAEYVLAEGLDVPHVEVDRLAGLWPPE